jgi:hypothetical protein
MFENRVNIKVEGRLEEEEWRNGKERIKERDNRKVQKELKKRKSKK